MELILILKIPFQIIFVVLAKIFDNMKKLLFFALGLPSFFMAQTTLFSDDFEVTPDLIVAGYTMYNDTNTPFGTYAGIFTNAWETVQWVGENNTVASCPSWFSPTAAADRWLITPSITIPAEATSAQLTFKARAHDNPPFADGFSLKVSTTDTAKASFGTELLNVAAATSTNMEDQPDYVVDLTAYKGSTVYLAWVTKYMTKSVKH